jgi:hypothetical protein
MTNEQIILDNEAKKGQRPFLYSIGGRGLHLQRITKNISGIKHLTTTQSFIPKENKFD